MRVKEGVLTGSEAPAAPPGRRPRIASERSDIDHLIATAGNLARLVQSDAVATSRLLAEATWNAQYACARVLTNRAHREARQAEDRARKAKRQ